MTSRHTKNSAHHASPWSFWLILLAVLCLLLVMCAMLWPSLLSGNAWSRSDAKEQKKSQPNNAADNVASTEADAEPWKPRFPISLAPSKENSPQKTNAPTAVTLSTNAAPAGQQPTSELVAQPKANTNLAIQHIPTPPDQQTAKEFLTLTLAFAANDRLAVHSALNDFINMPDVCVPLLTQMSRLWLERHLSAASILLSTKSPITIDDPITKQSAKIISVTPTGLSLEQGIGTYQLPWAHWDAKTLASWWKNVAQRDPKNSSLALIAVVANWISSDVITSRNFMRNFTAINDPAIASLQSQAMTVQNLAERWTALRWWEEGRLAKERHESTTVLQSASRLAGLIRLDVHEWAQPYVDYLQPAIQSSLTDALATPTVPIPGQEDLATLGITMQLTGTWSSVPQGAKLMGEGSVTLIGLTACKQTEIIFTPRRLSAPMRLQASSSEWVLQLNQALMVAKGPRGTIAPIPVTLYPRHPNVLRWTRGERDAPLKFVINHDQGLPMLIADKHPNQLRLAFPPESDVIITAIRCVP